MGNILAEAGCSQYQIMAIHGYTQAKTSEVYTKGARRVELAMAAMNKMETLHW